MAEAGVVGAVNGVAFLGEKDRVGHRRVVPLLAEMVLFHAERRERAGRRVVPGDAGRHRPGVEVRAVGRDGHLLGALVDLDQQVGMGRRERQRGGKGNERGSEAADMHDEPLAPNPL